MENRRTILKWFAGLPVLGAAFAWFTGGPAAKADEVKPVRYINKKSDLEYVAAGDVRRDTVAAFLNGRPISYCVRAHATEGWVECVHPKDGRRKSFYGDVLIKVADTQTIQKWMADAISPWDFE